MEAEPLKQPVEPNTLKHLTKSGAAFAVPVTSFLVWKKEKKKSGISILF